MNPGYVFGAIALAIFAGGYLFDRGWKRGHKQGLEEGRKLRAEESFKEGKREEANWWISADDQIEGEQKKIWGEGIGA